MKYRAIVKRSGDWWVGWLPDLPGVNAQERTFEGVVQALKLGAQDMLATQVTFEPEAVMTTIEVSEPEWTTELVRN